MRLNGAETRRFRSVDQGEAGAPLKGGDWVAETESALLYAHTTPDYTTYLALAEGYTPY